MSKYNKRGYRIYSDTEKSSLIESYLESGKTIKKFSQEHQIGVSTLSKWLRRSRSKSVENPECTQERTIRLVPESSSSELIKSEPSDVSARRKLKISLQLGQLLSFSYEGFSK